jgi:oligopeptide transport system permease protein
MEKENISYSYTDSSHEQHDVSLSPEMFTFKQADKRIHDVSFKGKPTTFFHDAVKRLVKNKSSVVSFVIVGLMVVLALLLPLIIPFDTNSPHIDEAFLEPKLFAAGTGFWDGTKTYQDQIYDDTTHLPIGNFTESAILKNTLTTYEGTTNSASTYAKGGYLRIGVDAESSYIQTPSFTLTASENPVLTFDMEGDIDPSAYSNSSYTVSAIYTEETVSKELILKPESSAYGEQTIDIGAAMTAASLPVITGAKIRYAVPAVEGIRAAAFLKNASLTANGATVSAASFTDANAIIFGKTWGTSGELVGLASAVITYCSFRYDTYEAIYGDRTMTLGESILKGYADKGYITYDFNTKTFTRLTDQSPIRDVQEWKITSGMGITVKEVVATVSYYRYIGYSSMPIHLLGTNDTGRDLLKFVAQGTRNSLGLAVIIALIVFTFGLIYGAIEGYFGGNIDLGLERIVDVLGNVPWIVVVTLCVLNLGHSFGVFILAMCLTGWIGTSSLTRTQFYRFKRREYVLASRSLGASDRRLIFRHILPNSLGTIVTSSVLIIPDVIFSEAAVSYLGIGLQGIASLGTILSTNQIYIQSYSYLLVFPSVILALLMIAFNLFGNGLRDAFNPSLKGSD